jgi:hypothetical protein
MAELNLFDSNGKKVKYLWSSDRQGEHQLTLPGQTLQTGSFFLQLNDNVNKYVIHIIRVK